MVSVTSMLGDTSTPIGEGLHAVRPVRFLWQSEDVADAATLLVKRPFQPLRPDPLAPCIVPPGSGLLVDFGCELNGMVELAVGMPLDDSGAAAQLRVRMGESVSEAMAEFGDRYAGNDYAIRDQVVLLPFTGTKTIGPSGFRFVRFDNVGQAPVALTHLRAVLMLDAAEPIGTFRSSDPALNRIWDVATWTVRLNMHDYLWDGVKRDRLVWIGDLHPMIGVIQAAFGPHPSVGRSLDLIRDTTPENSWMHGISSYSLWWILVQRRWWFYTGDREYLAGQRDYLIYLVKLLSGALDDQSCELLGGMRFLDWPSYGNDAAIEAGLQAMLILALEASAELCEELGEKAAAASARETHGRALGFLGNFAGVKAALAFQLLAGQQTGADAEAARDVLAQDGAAGLTAFLGYYVLEALARGGRIDAAVAQLRQFWGAMIDRGATSFWEDFSIDWLEDTGRIDELTPAGGKDLHGDFGRLGFRKSLCHGWSAGPAAFLSEHVLGVRIAAPGCSKLEISPQLGDLEWVEGAYPTPNGLVRLRAERKSREGVSVEIDLPAGIERVDSPATFL
jgi:alpha-L-rhamnosidase